MFQIKFDAFENAGSRSALLVQQYRLVVAYIRVRYGIAIGLRRSKFGRGFRRCLCETRGASSSCLCFEEATGISPCILGAHWNSCGAAVKRLRSYASELKSQHWV